MKPIMVFSLLMFLCLVWICSPIFSSSDPQLSPQIFSENSEKTHQDYELPFGNNVFAPSNAATTTGSFISQAEFIPAARCLSCHQQAHAQWIQSAHRNSFREPFYQANVKHLTRERSIAVTRHCESCHNPVALFSGALSAQAKFPRPFDEEGVSCSVCHSIVETNTQGIGSYKIAPPAMLVRADGQRIVSATDEEIWADVPSHRRAMMRPLLKTPEFCAACHKAAVIPELNKRKWLRSFAVYDEWQQSAFSAETVQPLLRRERQNCQSCHMPKSEGIASHRWPGGNTAIPAHYNWFEQTKATTQLLQSGILNVDMFTTHRRNSELPIIAETANINSNEEITVDVVVANKGVAHSFPAELRDIFEAWLEFKATDATGKILLHSGEIRADGRLDENAHAYRTIPIANDGSPITRHDIWNTRIGAFDRFIPAGRADIGRFKVQISKDAQLPITITAKVNYRRFTRNFTDWVNLETQVAPAPITEIVNKSVVLGEESNVKPLASRWRIYGIGLFDQQQYEAAEYALRQALSLIQKDSPEEVAIQTDIAMVCMKMERGSGAEKALKRANSAISQALKIDDKNPRVRFYKALLDIKLGSQKEALLELEQLSREYPRDRQVLMQLGLVYGMQQRNDEAKRVYEEVLKIDPDDADAHSSLSNFNFLFGDKENAQRELEEFNSYHVDRHGETIKRKYLREHRGLSSTWLWREYGDNPIGLK